SVGQVITGQGIAPETTITEVVGSNELKLSQAAGETVTGAELHAGSKLVKTVSPSAGTFKVGQTITGQGIPGEATIVAIPKAGELELSQAASEEVTEAELHA